VAAGLFLLSFYRITRRHTRSPHSYAPRQAVWMNKAITAWRTEKASQTGNGANALA